MVSSRACWVLAVVLLEIISVTEAQTWNATSTLDTITIFWEYEPCKSAAGVCDNYTISYTEKGQLSATETHVSEIVPVQQKILTGLTPETEYVLKVKAVFKNSTETSLFTYDIATAPYKVASLTSPSATTTTIYVEWTKNPSSSVTTYQLRVYDEHVGGAPVVDQSNIAQSSFNITGLTAGRSYQIMVNAVRFGQWSEEVVLQGIAIPLQPASVSVVAIDTDFLNVTWVTPAHADGVASSYKVEYKKSDASTFQVATCPTLASLHCEIQRGNSDLPGQAYTIQVKSVVKAKESAATEKQGNTRPLPVSANSISFTTFTTSSVTVVWIKPSGTVYDTFRLGFHADGATVIETDVDKTLNLAPFNLNQPSVSGKAYNVTISTVSGSELSATAMGSFNFNPDKPSFGVQDVAMDIGTSNIVIPLVKPTNGVFDSYELVVSNTENGLGEVFKTNIPGDTTAYNWTTSVEPGTVYNVALRAQSGSQYGEAVTQEFHSKPSAVEFTPYPFITLTSAAVYWRLPSGRFENYKLELVLGGVVQSTETLAAENKTYPSLLTGTTYVVKVWAVTRNTLSELTSIDIRTVPATPSTLTSTEVTNSSISVAWGAPSEAGTFDNYLLSISDGSSPLSPLKTVLTHVFNNLSPARNYTVSIQTVSGEKQSDVLSEVFITRPNPPTNLAISGMAEREFHILWDAPQDGSYTDHLLIVEYASDNSKETFSIPVASGRYLKLVSSRRPGGHYTVTVTSRYQGVESTPITTTATTPPSQPWDVQVDHVGKTSIEFHWEVPPGVDFDQFYVKVSELYGAKEVVLNTSTPVIQRIMTVPNLKPGSVYQIDVFLVSRGVRSLTPRFNYATTLPNSVSSLEKGFTNTTAVQVTWSEPQGSTFETYELSISPVEVGVVSPVTINRTESPLQHLFSPLKPGRTYTFNISTATSTGVKSNPFSRTITAKPMVVESLVAKATSETEIRVSWNVNSDSVQDNFMISYSKESDPEQIINIPFTPGVFTYERTLSPLLSGYQYQFIVAAVSNGEANQAERVDAITPPKPIKSLVSSNIQAMSAELSWETEANSRQNSFEVRYRPTLRNASSDWISRLTSTNTIELRYLFPGEFYEVSVTAISMDVKGVAYGGDFTALPLPPSPSFSHESYTDRLIVKWTYDRSQTYVESWLVRYQVQGVTSAWTESVVNVNASSTQYEIVLTPLISGQNYTVEVKSYTQGNVSSAVDGSMGAAILGTVRPSINSRVTENVAMTTNDTIVVTFNENTLGVFGHYFFCLMADSECVGGIVVRNQGDANAAVTFRDNVMAGKLYKLQLFVVSGDQQSAPVEVQVRTVPNQVQATINVESFDQLTVEWPHPAGVVSNYEVNCTGPQCLASQMVNNNQQVVRLLYDKLLPYTNYSFSIVTISGDKRSTAIMLSSVTQESAPSAPRDVEVRDLEPTRLRLTWLPPASPNGKLIEYMINYRGVKAGRQTLTGFYRQNHESHTTNPLQNVLQQEIAITNIQAGYNYTFSVSAKTIQYGAEASVSVLVPTAAPTLRTDLQPQQLAPGAATVTATDTHSRTVSLKTTLKQAFTTTNGELIGYTVIVAEVTENNAVPAVTSGAFIKSYQEVRNQDVWEPYQVIPMCDVFDGNANCAAKRGAASRRRRDVGVREKRSTDEVAFLVGALDCSSSSAGEYCNGQLRPGRMYKIKLRGYTEGNFFTDTEYSSVIRTDPDHTGLIVGLVVALVVLLVVALVVIWVMRRKGMFGGSKQMKGSEPDTNTSMNTIGGGRLSGRKSKRDHSRPIKLHKFAEHVESLAKDGEFGYAEEYEDLKHIGRCQPYTSAEIPENRPKNRFTNIYPYDHSRVKLLPLDDVEGSDYINASYIPGYNGKREFIVSQGPMHSTVDDFWRMIWEQNVRTIVMLTLCVEKMKEKCYHYWPEDKEPVNYGDIIVVILSETSWGSYNITEFKIIKGDIVRHVRHYHFLKWPDFRALEPEDILGFIRVVRAHMQSHKSPGPVLVHCSAGVGRSGTFIAIDRSLQHIKEHDSLDIFGMVHEMRLNRVYMVQTEKQYVSIHKCLLHVIQGKEAEAEMVQGMDNKAFIDDDAPYQNYRNGAVGDSQVQLSEL